MKTIFLFLTSLFLLSTAAAQQPAPDKSLAANQSDPCQSLQQQNQQLSAKLRDWPNLSQYREADAELGPPAKGESRVVFLGDSITQMWDLAASFPGKPYVNRGISGQTTPQILLRFRQDVIALQPKTVVILAGTNDIAENTGPTTLAAIEDNLISMVELAQKNSIRVILASLLPAARYPWHPEIQPAEKIQALNRWIKDYAAHAGIDFLDYYTSMADPKSALKAELSPGLTNDGVHPNHAGFALMTQLAAREIEKK
jgi:lysophospholipase L1-like esterase